MCECFFWLIQIGRIAAPLGLLLLLVAGEHQEEGPPA
jgi:hypothetical protein